MKLPCKGFWGSKRFKIYFVFLRASYVKTKYERFNKFVHSDVFMRHAGGTAIPVRSLTHDEMRLQYRTGPQIRPFAEAI